MRLPATNQTVRMPPLLLPTLASRGLRGAMASVARRGGWLVKDRNVRRLADDNSEETGVAVVSGVLPCLAREGSGC